MSDLALSKTEKAVMTEIYLQATKKGGTCLIRPIDLLTGIPYSVELKASELDTIIKNLGHDGFYDCIETNKKGEPYYCITLSKSGHAFRREIQREKRSRKNQVVLKIALAALAAIVGVVIRVVVKIMGGP